eukprot:TRINITY_DN307_c5_g3_i1.p1 TRINITY_DN307_c5_g3~~TRINITY_DN307_c5_g3_i1.p1  ORF type:complete len:504 (-),score=161.44 TRINITY_DN307_c5_g3_i1:248-1660(-)
MNAELSEMEKYKKHAMDIHPHKRCHSGACRFGAGTICLFNDYMHLQGCAGCDREMVYKNQRSQCRQLRKYHIHHHLSPLIKESFQRSKFNVDKINPMDFTPLLYKAKQLFMFKLLKPIVEMHKHRDSSSEMSKLHLLPQSGSKEKYKLESRVTVRPAEVLHRHEEKLIEIERDLMQHRTEEAKSEKRSESIEKLMNKYPIFKATMEYAKEKNEKGSNNKGIDGKSMDKLGNEPPLKVDATVDSLLGDITMGSENDKIKVSMDDIRWSLAQFPFFESWNTLMNVKAKFNDEFTQVFDQASHSTMKVHYPGQEAYKMVPSSSPASNLSSVAAAASSATLQQQRMVYHQRQVQQQQQQQQQQHHQQQQQQQQQQARMTPQQQQHYQQQQRLRMQQLVTPQARLQHQQKQAPQTAQVPVMQAQQRHHQQFLTPQQHAKLRAGAPQQLMGGITTPGLANIPFTPQTHQMNHQRQR